MLYAISDIHGNAAGFVRALALLGGPDAFRSEENKLLLLGDYIDYGTGSFSVLKAVYALSTALPQNVIALRGNHEEDFLEFLDGADTWLNYDRDLKTVRGFLSDKQIEHLGAFVESGSVLRIYSYVRNCIKENHPKLVKWLRELPYFYETDTQIFVHAGVDEEAGEFWKMGTMEYIFVGKFPATKGRFCKDVIAGHVSARRLSGDPGHMGVYYDGESHYFIDGGNGRHLLCLAYDEKTQKYCELLTEDSARGAAGTLLPI